MNFRFESVHLMSTRQRIRIIRGTTEQSTIEGTTDLATHEDFGDVEVLTIDDEVDISVIEVPTVHTTTDSLTYENRNLHWKDTSHKQPTQNRFVIFVDTEIITRNIATKENQQTETNRFVA